MYIRSYLVALSLALATLSSPVKRDATTVENDIQNIDSQTNSLGSSIAAFPSSGGNIFQVFAIAQAADSLDSALKSSTSDATASAAFTEADGSDVVGLLETLAADTEQVLNLLVGKQPALANLPVSGAGGIVEQELQTLKSDSDAFAAALMPKLPADLTNSAQAQVTLINNAFSSAISAFS